MIGLNERARAGWIYLLALRLHRRDAQHPGIGKAIQWLDDHGYARKARDLSNIAGAAPRPRPAGSRKGDFAAV